MTIRISDITEPQKFISKHHIHTTIGPDEFYVLTGVIIVDWKTKVTGSGWNRENSLLIGITIPGIPLHKALRLRHWAPFLTLNSISNDGPSNNAGWAVDEFSILDVSTPIQKEMVVKVQIAGRDSDGWIHRLGYHITLLGNFVDYSVPGPF